MWRKINVKLAYHIQVGLWHGTLQDASSIIFKMQLTKPKVFRPGSRYSRMEQVKFVEDSLYFSFLKAVFHKFYLLHSWIPWPLVLCFIIFLHFLESKSIPDVTGKKYVSKTFKRVKQFENYQDRKCELNIIFSKRRYKLKIFPKFLRFYFTNTNLKESTIYIKFKLA